MTKVRPCIDLHEGQVKQIVGSTLIVDKETNTAGRVNFCSDEAASYFAHMYAQDGLTGGHVIMLGDNNEDAARDALQAWPGGMQVGGGINDQNCQEWLNAGASKIIVTSYVFREGRIDYERLEKLVRIVGKDKLVLDLSCRKRDGIYWVVTNKWQTFTDTAVDESTLKELANFCDEFLVHAVDVEGKQAGIQQDLVELLGEHCPIPVTYAGGVRTLEDLDLVHLAGRSKVDVTVGSALDIFGGALPYLEVVKWHRTRNVV